MSKRVIFVVAALPEEVRHFCRCHALERDSGPGSRWRGAVAGQRVEVACTGVGMRRAGAGVRGILGDDPPGALIFVGTAGALSPGLGIGDLVVAERIASGEDPTSVVVVPETAWLDRARALAAVRVGTLLSTSRVVATAAEKRALVGRHALEEENAAVDMESYAWASVASARGLPFVVVRAMSDTVDEDLPLDLNGALRPDGSLSRARVLGAALRQPGGAPGLWELRDRVQRCSRVLEQALVSILA